MPAHAIGDAAVREVAPWLERLARIGYAVKGVLYLTIGLLSARAALGAGRAVTDAHDAMTWLHGAFGRPLLAIVAVGLAGYGVWRIIAAVTDAERRGREPKGVAMRIGGAVLGVLHLALAGTALGLALWQRSGGGHETQARHWTGRALEVPGGEYLVWCIALAIGGYGAWQLSCAWRAQLDENLELDRLGPPSRRLVIAISRFGIAARGIVFITIAVLFARAARGHDASQAGTTRSSMLELFAFGRWAFIGIAVGVAAYGIYELVEARYRRIRVH